MIFAKGPIAFLSERIIQYEITKKSVASITLFTMKRKLIICFLFLFSIQLSAKSQSIYRLTYQLPGKDNAGSYDAFFVLYENGSGFARINYLPADTNHPDTVQVEMKIEENYVLNKEGILDSSKMMYEVKDPKFIKGNKDKKFDNVFIWFRNNPGNNLLEPWGVTVSTGNSDVVPAKFLTVDTLSGSTISRKLALQYFNPKDKFFQNLFPRTTRGDDLTPDQRKMKLFLLVVASTLDEDIGTSCLKDGRKAIEIFDSVARVLKITGERKVFDSIYGDKFNKANVLKAIGKINPGPNDIVIFYYSGHGFSDAAQKDKLYPYLDLRDPRTLNNKPAPNLREQTLNMDSIYTMIKEKKARLNLVLSDCCNNEIFSKRIVAPPPPARLFRGDVKWNYDNVKALFLNERRSLIMTGASKYERAAGNNTFGGFFTYFFLNSMTTYLSLANINASWKKIVEDASKLTAKKASITTCKGEVDNICKQTPYPPKLN